MRRSFFFRVDGVRPSSGGDLAEVTLFAGVDRDHRQHSGTLSLRLAEVDCLFDLLSGGSTMNDDVEIELDTRKLDEWEPKR